MHEHLIILPVEGHFTDAGGGFLSDNRPRRTVQCAPERHNIGIGGTPCVYQRLHFFLGHLRAHGLQRADSAAVAAVVDEPSRYGKTMMLSGILYVINSSRADMSLQFFLR